MTGGAAGGAGAPGRPAGGCDVSVVVPCYGNAWALPELVDRVRAALAGRGLVHELILVDDASPDGLRELASELARRDPAVGVVVLAANRGQNRAVTIGLAHGRGRLSVVMDGDLQDPPEAIPRLLERAEEGYDAVFATRVGVYQGTWRMATSKLFKLLLARLAGVPAGAGMFLVLSRRMAERLVAEAPARPWIVAQVGLAGWPVAALPVRRERRRQGRSAYRGGMRLAAALGALRFTLARRLGAPARPRPFRETEVEARLGRCAGAAPR